MMKPELSVVVPVYNEATSLPNLFARLFKVLHALSRSFEVIAIDDGSTDCSFATLQGFAVQYPQLRVIRFGRNFGQTAALCAGIEHVRGDIIVSIDSDLENAPEDIPRLLAKMDEGFDVVSGWRQQRWRGAFFNRRLPSIVANRLISALTGLPLHDYGCTLKAYRAKIIRDMKLYGEMHRFMPAYAMWQGGRVAELPVMYTPRAQGKSNYGLTRIFRVLLDLVMVVFVQRYMSRPMHFFGAFGFTMLVLGTGAGAGAVVLRIFRIRHIVDTPLPILATLLILIGVQFILFGVMAEVLMRIYYESQHKRPYVIKETIN
jgi:dolichol-phosphate mannosyltransferase